MTDSDRPEGELFSRLYIERGAPEQDSKRMRKRLTVAVRRYDLPEDMVEIIEGKLGIEVATDSDGVYWEFFLMTATCETCSTQLHSFIGSLHLPITGEGRAMTLSSL